MEMYFILAAVVIFFIAKGIYDRVNFKKKTSLKLKKNFGKLVNEETEESLQLIDSFFIHKFESDTDFHIDSITSNDIKIPDFFVSTNSCKSQAGAEYYYYMLNTPCFEKKEIEKREAIIDFFSKNEKERTEVLYELSTIGRSKKKISLFSCIEMLDELSVKSNINNWIAIAGFFGSICLMIYNVVVGAVMLIGFVFYNIFTYFKIKGELQGYLFGVRKLCSMLICSEHIVNLNIPELQDIFGVLKEENSKLKGLKKGAFAINSEVSGDLASMLMEYVNMLLHLDLISFNRSLKTAAGNKDGLKVLYEKIGYIDSLLCVANLRQAVNTWCVPEFTDKERHLEFTGLYHPSLENPVPADLCTETSILLTGSNASGKSTFLKAVALNAVLAQSINTVFAESYKGCFFKVYTSMALNDNIYNGESYYITEIKALKRVIDAERDYTVLAFIDEVLRGTNTVERIASSVSALNYLTKENTICFAATHDIELTRLLEENYKNYHFEESLDEEGNIVFDYMLKEGPSTTKNAIKLLISLGYEKAITDNAERMSEHFVETGVWKK